MAYGTLAHYLQQVRPEWRVLCAARCRACRYFRAAEEWHVRGVRVRALVLQVKRSLQQCDGDVLAVSIVCRSRSYSTYRYLGPVIYTTTPNVRHV